MERKQTQRKTEASGGEGGWGDYGLSQTEMFSIKCCEQNTFPSTVAKLKRLPEMKAVEMKPVLVAINMFHFTWLNHRLKKHCSPTRPEPCDHIILDFFAK